MNMLNSLLATLLVSLKRSVRIVGMGYVLFELFMLLLIAIFYDMLKVH